MLGSAVTAIKKGPEYEGGHGALVLEMAGACWVLPLLSLAVLCLPPGFWEVLASG